ncbi:hypothetical protein D3C83_290470 [compost metagenome]
MKFFAPAPRSLAAAMKRAASDTDKAVSSRSASLSTSTELAPAARAAAATSTDSQMPSGGLASTTSL